MSMMKFISKFTKNKIFLRFFITYIIIMLIPIVLGIVVYNKSYNALRKYAIEANTAMLTQAKSTLEKQIVDEINNIVLLLSSDNTVQSYLGVNKFNQPDDVSKLFDLKKNLYAFQEVSNLILNYYVLYRKSNLAFTANLIYRIPLLYNNILKYEDREFQEWYQDIFDSYYYKEYLPAKNIIYEGKNHSVITYLHSLGYGQQPDGVIMILIDDQKVRDILSNINSSRGGWASVINNQGQVLSTTVPAGVNIKGLFNEINDRNGSIQKEINGQKYIITYLTSSFNDWKYVSAQPFTVVMDRINAIKRITIYIITLAILLGLISAIIMTSRNTKPIQDILKLVRDKIDSNNDNKTLNYLQSAVNELIHNNEELEKSMNEQKGYLRNAFLDKIINGEYKSADNIKRMLKYTGITIKGKYFAVVLMEVSDEIINNEKLTASEEVLEELNIKRVIIKDVVTKNIMPLWEKCIIHNIDENTLVLIMEFEKEEKNWCYDKINNVVSSATEMLLNDYNIKMNVAVGSICNNLVDIARSYEEAYRAMNYRFAQESDQICWYNEIEIDSSHYYYPLEQETRLIKAVRNGNGQQVEDILENIYQENFIDRRLSSENINELLSEIKGSIYKILEQLSWEEDKEFEEVEEMLDKLKLKTEICDRYKYLVKVINYICKLVNKHKNTYYEILKDRILKYTRKHYQNEEFCLAMIAEEFDLTEVYLSHLFKEYIGENFSSYLENMRMERACRLLIETNYTIKIIAQKSGYNSHTSFSRAFKRNKGISPSHYRRCN